jgi:signal transduction histidine kinase
LIDEYFSEQARLASLGLATSKLTHDIRNLLSSLSLIAERLRQNDSDTDRATADRMSLTVSRALTLCDWAAQYSQDKQRNMSIDRHNLFSIVEDVLTFVKQYDPRDQVQVTNSVSANMMVWCDKTLLFRILFNLSLNAVQAMQGQESRSFLKIAAARYKDHICIDVADGGPGMEPSDEDIFYAGSSYFSIKSRSTGLGLIIAQDLTRWLGGEVKILHTGPSGTVLRVAIRNIAPEPVESGGSSDIVDYASVTDYTEPS